MDKVKARKQGNAVMVTLAKKFNIPEGKEFYITQEKDGTISLIPKIKDYFEGAGDFLPGRGSVSGKKSESVCTGAVLPEAL